MKPIHSLSFCDGPALVNRLAAHMLPRLLQDQDGGPVLVSHDAKHTPIAMFTLP